MDLIWSGLVEAARLLVTGDAATIRIIGLSLVVSGTATLLATLAGVPLGTLLALRRVPGQALLSAAVNTGMGLPPVVVGLVVSLLLWRSGPLGPLELLYTPTAMVLAQFVVAAPIAAGLSRSAVAGLDPGMVEALRVDGAVWGRVGWESVRAARPQVLVAIAAAFGRAVSEVGASLMVGGNILGATRIMTTAITLEVSRGEFARAIALGLVLLGLSFLVNIVLYLGGRLGAAEARA
ncbi:MAG: ABC transporter permease [Chloroflexota bacterium]|nr:ABC transporter permease [Chloroflexota bacterium]